MNAAHVATVAPEPGGYLVSCAHGCRLGTTAHAASLAAAEARVRLHQMATAPLLPAVPLPTEQFERQLCPVRPRAGDRFEHARFLDPKGGTGKARCTVTSFRRGLVYWTYTADYDAGDHKGSWFFDLARAGDFVGRWL